MKAEGTRFDKPWLHNVLWSTWLDIRNQLNARAVVGVHRAAVQARVDALGPIEALSAGPRRAMRT